MKGFDRQYTDLTDYILKCARVFWEGRESSALDWHCGEDLLAMIRSQDTLTRLQWKKSARQTRNVWFAIRPVAANHHALVIQRQSPSLRTF